MRKNIFLSESRRNILDGSTDWAENSVTTEKSRIRGNAKTALDELTEIAQSPEIENRSVFDPEEIGTLLYWILNDPAEMGEFGGLVGTSDEPPEGVPKEAYTKVPEDLQQYRREVHSETAQELLRIDNPSQGRR